MRPAYEEKNNSFRFRQIGRWSIPVIAILGMTCILQPAMAGGGPENVFLVVNPNSQASLTIANHYRALRQIPSENVFYLAWNPKEQITDVDRFREQILIPILEEIARRELTEQIDYVVYSADFPWGIELEKDIQRFVEQHPELLPPPKHTAASENNEDQKDSLRSRWPRALTPQGSINGLTYLYLGVLARRPDYYMSLRANQYTRRAIPEQKDVPTLGFSSQYQFGPHGEIVAKGERYLLSMVLGVVADEDTRGNTLQEVLEYLSRSAAADGSLPKGTFYFVQNGDIRSRTRDAAFPEVVESLRALGVRAEIVHGTMPQKKSDCQGVMMGTAQFDWATSGSTILPGAICDHLTSLGGVMTQSGGQTPLTEFLRHGAAAASGTVTEPFAIAEKFPMPTVHLHYARGCTVAEAFYQSVYGPYQLLIVGDPLCRPWAIIPHIRLQDSLDWDSLRGTVSLLAEASFDRPGFSTSVGSREVDRFEWFVDGHCLGRSAPGEPFSLDTSRWDDGYHELRVVAVEKGLIATRGTLVQPLFSRNHGGQITARLVTPSARLGQKVVVEIDAPGALAVVVRHNSRIVAKAVGDHARLTIDTAQLGTGPVRLQAVGLGQGSSLNRISRPMDIVIGREE